MKKTIFLIISVVMVFLFAGCKNNEKVASDDSINWYITGVKQKDIAEVNRKVNDYLESKYKLKVNIQQLDWAQYPQKMSSMINAGEDYDIAYTADWLSGFTYESFANKGAFLDISKYLDGENKKLKSTISPYFWEGTKINGKQFMVPTQKEASITENYIFNAELVDKYKVPYKEIKTYDELEPWLRLIKDKEGITPLFLTRGYNNPYLFDNLTTGIGVNMETEGNKIEDYYLTKDYKERVKKIRSFYLDGLVNQDASNVEDLNKIVGKQWFVTSSVVGPTDKAVIENIVEKKVYMNPQVKPLITNMSVSAGNVINKNTKKPEKCIKLLEAVNTDPKLMNLLSYGIEGKHYKIEDGQVQWLSDHANYDMLYYMFGNYYNLTTLKGNDKDSWNILKKYNDTSEKSEALGFRPNIDNLSTELASINNVVEEFKPIINTGSADPDEKLKEFNNKLKKSGIDKVINSIDDSYKKFLSTKK